MSSPIWHEACADFLANIEDSPLSSPTIKENCPKVIIGKELVITEARKLIRQEKFQDLQTKKNEKILQREIEFFRDSLEFGRTLQMLEIEKQEEQAQVERRHRQIRNSAILKTKLKSPVSPQINAFPEKVRELKNKKAVDISTNQEIVPKQLKLSANTSITTCCPTDKPVTKEKDSYIDSVKRDEITVVPVSENKIDEKTGVKLKQREIIGKEKKKVLKSMERNKRVKFLEEFIKRKLTMYYWTQWKLFVTVKKKEREEEIMWMEKINTFMKRLNDRSKHQNQIKDETKKPEVKEQKRKLRGKTAPVKEAVRVEVTEDRDLDEMKAEITKSAEHTQFQLRAQTVQSLHPSLKGKAKLIKLITTIGNKEEPTTEKIEFPYPDILEDMNRRQNERKQRIAEIQERKRAIEEEKDRIVKEKYEQQLLEAELEKKRKIQAFREKLRKEKEEQDKRKQEWTRMKVLNESAVNLYRNKLLTRYGLEPWVRLLHRRRIKNHEALEQDIRRLKRWTLETWKDAIIRIQESKMIRAIALRAKHLLRSSMWQWEQFCKSRRQQTQVAIDWYDFALARRSITNWLDFVELEKKQLQEKHQEAISFYKRKITIKCLQHWMLLPQVLYLEREKEKRKREWREKVQQVLPDFKPTMLSDI